VDKPHFSRALKAVINVVNNKCIAAVFATVNCNRKLLSFRG